MGATYLEMGKWDEAIQEFQIVLKDILIPDPFLRLQQHSAGLLQEGRPE